MLLSDYKKQNCLCWLICVCLLLVCLCTYKLILSSFLRGKSFADFDICLYAARVFIYRKYVSVCWLDLPSVSSIIRNGCYVLDTLKYFLICGHFSFCVCMRAAMCFVCIIVGYY